MFRRNRAPEPRRPHPDPRTETRLQRIIALRESAARKSTLISQYATEIGNLSSVYRSEVVNGYISNAAKLESRLKDLQAEIRQLETEIDDTHENIAERTAELSETDLSYL
jgi:chromosome segregation ATPase